MDRSQVSQPRQAWQAYFPDSVIHEAQEVLMKR